MDAKTIRSIIADLNDRQTQLLTKLKRMDDDKLEVQAELALNEKALWQWYEALEETEGER